MRSFPLALLTAAAVVPTGCVSMGPNYNPAVVQSLRPGMDRSEVIALLGRPTSRVRLADGSQHLMWIHSKGSMFGATARAVTLIFGADDKYVGTFSEAETDIR